MLSHPWLLIALLIGLAALYLAVPAALRRAPVSGLGRAARLLVAVLLAAAVAGPFITGGAEPLHAVFLVDASESIASPEDAAALCALAAEGLDRLPAPPRVDRLLFAEDAEPLEPDEPLNAARIRAVVRRQGTDIESALLRALARLPERRRSKDEETGGIILLETDGRETTGDALRSAALLRSAGVRFFLIPAGLSSAADVRLDELRAPPRAQAGTDVRLTIVAASTRTGPARVRLFHEGAAEPLYDKETLLAAGIPQEIKVYDRLPPGGARYRAVIDPRGGEDRFPGNNVVRAAVDAEREPKALIVSRHGPGALDDAIARSGVDSTQSGTGSISVARRSPADAAQLTAADLAAFRIVILDDLARLEVPDEVQRRLVDFVRQGGGLWLFGGPNSLGAGGWRDSDALASVLGVRMQPSHGTRRLVVFVLDWSASMREPPAPGAPDAKYERLRAAVRSMAEGRLNGSDLVAMVFFNSEVVPLPDERRFMPPEPARVAAAFQAAGLPDNDTFFLPALDAADGLVAALGPAMKRRVVCLLSDGEAHDADADRPRLFDAARRIAGRDAVLHTVLVSSNAAEQPLMQRLAEAGKGRAFVDASMERLGEIFLDIAEQPELRQHAAPGRAFQLSRCADHAVIDGLAGLPALGGYVRAGVHPDAVTAWTTSGIDPDPALALRAVGRGRTAVFTGGIDDAWQGTFFDSSWGSPRFVRQTADWLSGGGDERLAVDCPVVEGRRKVRVFVSRPDGTPDPSRTPKVRVRPVDGEEWTAGGGPENKESGPSLTAVSVGVFEADFPFAAEGLYRIEARDGEGRREEYAVVPYPRELRESGVDRLRLDQIAAAGGGEVLDPWVFCDRVAALAPAPGRLDLAPWFLAGALALFSLELLLRVVEPAYRLGKASVSQRT
jgi:Mg-chelatase subunit ChlD/uncharacterized membrane protein